jgi:hypothetical protein
VGVLGCGVTPAALLAVILRVIVITKDLCTYTIFILRHDEILRDDRTEARAVALG